MSENEDKAKIEAKFKRAFITKKDALGMHTFRVEANFFCFEHAWKRLNEYLISEDIVYIVVHPVSETSVFEADRRKNIPYAEKCEDADIVEEKAVPCNKVPNVCLVWAFEGE